MELRDFNPAIKYGAKLTGTSLDDGYILLGDSSNEAEEVSLQTTYDALTGVPFVASDVSIGTAELNIGAGQVELLSATTIGTRTPYVTGFVMKNFGDNSCAGGSAFFIGDAAGTIIWHGAATALSTGAVLGSGAGTPYVQLQTLDLAGTAGRAIVLTSSGSMTGTPTLSCTIWGILK